MFAVASMETHSKASLRRHYLHLRRALGAEEADALNRGLLEQAQAIDWQQFGAVHIFLPILAQQEPDTFRMIDWMRHTHPGIRVVVPRVASAQNGQLSHYVLDEQTVLEKNNWGIPEPAGGLEVDPVDLDAVLVPLLAFDLSGHRVGYGQGFYDRFLAACRPDVLKIGISFFEPVPRIADVLESDVPLDGCITPRQVYWFGKNARRP